MRPSYALTLVGAVLLGASPVYADAEDVRPLAAAAYARGARAYNLGQYATAARELAAADALAPNPVVLRTALRAATRADDAVLAMTLVERAEHRGETGAVATTARETRARFGGRVGMLTLACPAHETCHAIVDGEPMSDDRWVSPGSHSVEWESDGQIAHETVQVAAGERRAVAPPAPSSAHEEPPPVAPVGAEPPEKSSTDEPPLSAPSPSVESAQPSRPSRPLSPVFFWAGLGATAIVGGVTVVSAIDTANKHLAFEENQNASADSGRAAQVRTNVLVGVTAATALVTAAIGLVLVEWGHPSGAVGPSSRAPSTLLEF